MLKLELTEIRKIFAYLKRLGEKGWLANEKDTRRYENIVSNSDKRISTVLSPGITSAFAILAEVLRSSNNPVEGTTFCLDAAREIMKEAEAFLAIFEEETPISYGILMEVMVDHLEKKGFADAGAEEAVDMILDFLVDHKMIPRLEKERPIRIPASKQTIEQCTRDIVDAISDQVGSVRKSYRIVETALALLMDKWGFVPRRQATE